MVKFISGGLLQDEQPQMAQMQQPQIPQGQQEMPQGPSYLDEAKRVGSGILASIPQGVENLFSLPGRAISGALGAAGVDLANAQPWQQELQNQPANPNAPFDMQKFKEEHSKIANTPIKQHIARGLGYDNLDPQNLPEKIAHGIAEDIPLLISSGPGGFLNRLGGSAAQNVGSKIAEEAGFGPIGQIISGLGTGSAYRYLSKNGIGGLRRAAKETMNQRYANFEANAENIVEDGSQLQSGLDGLKDRARADLGIKQADDVVENLSEVARKIDRAGNVNLLSVREQQNRLNKIIPKIKDADERNIYKAAAGELGGYIDTIAKANPKIAEDWFKAKSLYKGIEGTTALRRLIEKSTDLKGLLKSKFAQALFGGSLFSVGAKLLSAPVAAKAVVGTYGARTLHRIADFARQDETRKLYNEAIQAALYGDKAAIANALKGLNQYAKEFESK